MPNLMQILSIFLKLQAVKQSGRGFSGLPGLYIFIHHQMVATKTFGKANATIDAVIFYFSK